MNRSFGLIKAPISAWMVISLLQVMALGSKAEVPGADAPPLLSVSSLSADSQLKESVNQAANGLLSPALSSRGGEGEEPGLRQLRDAEHARFSLEEAQRILASNSLLSPALSSKGGEGEEENFRQVRGTAGARLSLEEAQRMAVARNWDLLASAAGVDAAVAQKIVAREFPNPTLAVSSTMINLDHHPNSTVEGNGLWDRSYDTVFAINQLFEIGGKRRSRRASAQAGFESAKAQLDEARRTLELAVTKAYVAVAQAEENVRVLTQSSETLHKEAQLAGVRLKAGEISDSDRRQIEITAERFDLDARAAESSAAQARVALEILLGVARPKGEVRLSEGLEELCAMATAGETSHWGGGRPDVVAAEAALRKAEADLRLQKANRIPDPTVLAQYEHQPPDTVNSAGFGVSFPLPLWNRNRGNILAAEAARDQARLAYEKAQAQAAADIAMARFAFDNASNRWASIRDSIRPKSEQIRATMAYAYEKGGASLLDLLVAERNDNDVRLGLAQAASDTAMAAAALKAATWGIQGPEIR